MDTPPLFINRPKLNNSKDYLMLIGRILFIVKVFSAATLINMPCRVQIFHFMGIKRKPETWEHWILTTTIVISAGGLAVFLPGIINALSFIGGTSICFICVTLPYLMYIKLNKQRHSSVK